MREMILAETKRHVKALAQLLHITEKFLGIFRALDVCRAIVSSIRRC